MNDSTLIRRANLKALKLAPITLAEKVGNSKQYWSDLLRDPKKSFGETIARKIEEKLELPRGSLDQPVTGQDGRESIGDGVGKVTDHSANRQSIPTIPAAMPFTRPNLKQAFLLMGSLIGPLDERSKVMLGDLLKDLALHCDDALDIAEKASAIATVQRPVTTNKALNKAIRGHRDAVETGHTPLR